MEQWQLYTWDRWVSYMMIYIPYIYDETYMITAETGSQKSSEKLICFIGLSSLIDWLPVILNLNELTTFYGLKNRNICKRWRVVAV